MFAIVVCTTPTVSPWLNNCLTSLKGYDKYPIIIVSNYGWEIGKIKFIVEHTDVDEFVLLQETVEIKDTSLFDRLFVDFAGKSVFLSPRGMSYLCKYRREVLKNFNLPEIHNKKEAVLYETLFHQQYRGLDTVFEPFPELQDTNIFEEKFGRNNMKIENQYLIKWKGCWHPSMIEGW